MAFHPIRHRRGKWVVLAKSGGTLGVHDTYAEALRQLRAVEWRRHGSNPPMFDGFREELAEEDWIELVRLVEEIGMADVVAAMAIIAGTESEYASGSESIQWRRVMHRLTDCARDLQDLD